MGTRSCIARKTRSGFKGVYHHWDGYPSGVGSALFKLYNGHFEKNLEKMLNTIINEHPAGWSTLCEKDFKLEPGFSEEPLTKGLVYKSNRPVCYCHGDRNEPGNDLNHNNAASCGCEYAYVLGMETRVKGKGRKEPVMNILSSYCLDGAKMVGFFGLGDEKSIWMPIGKVFLNDPEPNWETMKIPDMSLEKIVVNLLKEKGIIIPYLKNGKK